MKRKILVVDDTRNVQVLISDFLSGQDFEVLTAGDGREALEVVHQSSPDLILLDIMMPNMDGYQFISHLRRESSVPVIMITAKQQEADIIRGFDLGADDYITKPFRLRELLVRMRAVLRRAAPSPTSEPCLVIGDISLDTGKHEVWQQNQLVELTPLEFLVLEMLMQAAGQVVRRAELCMRLIENGYSGSEATLKIHIRNLRLKLSDDLEEAPLHRDSVWGGLPVYGGSGMKRSLKAKLILSYLAVALITVLVVSVVIRLTSGQSLMELVVEQQTAALKEDGAGRITPPTAPWTASSMPISSGPRSGCTRASADGRRNPPNMRDIRGVQGLVDAEYRALMPTFGYDIGETVPADMIKESIAVEVDGQTIAWILPDTGFRVQAQRRGAALPAAHHAGNRAGSPGRCIGRRGDGLFAGGRLLKPIRRLTKASQALAHGNLQQQVPVTSQDELGQLTTTFNQMSADLARSDQQRKRMTADITHDLSTPLQIISGYMEMLEDDEVTLTPQRIEIIKTEIEHLRRLVSDLSTLTQVEAGGLELQLQPVQPAALLEHIYQAYQPIAARQEVELVLEAPTSLPCIQVDEVRMLQVLKNLMDNALRYTPKGGQITPQCSGW